MTHRIVKGLLAGATALLVGLSVALPASAGPDAPNRGRFAALGDSFAAGVGNTPIRGAGDSLRSSEAYPVLLAGATNKVTFLAASGATTADVTANQVRTMPTGVRQVTLTLGGNDVGFADVALDCAAGLGSPDCNAAMTAAGEAMVALPVNLAATITAVRTRAPGATIYVTGYPQLFQPTGGTCQTLQIAQFPYDPFALLTADGAVLELNQTIEGTVNAIALATKDQNLKYVDVTGEFDGYGMCNPAGYIFPPAPVPGGFAPSSLHPNAAGQEAYAEALTDAGFVN